MRFFSDIEESEDESLFYEIVPDFNAIDRFITGDVSRYLKIAVAHLIYLLGTGIYNKDRGLLYLKKVSETNYRNYMGSFKKYIVEWLELNNEDMYVHMTDCVVDKAFSRIQ